MCVCVCGEKGEVRLVVRGGEGLGGARRRENGRREGAWRRVCGV